MSGRGDSQGDGPAGAQAELTVDLSALVANWRMLAQRAAPAACGAAVKADAYGVGLAPVARALSQAGCEVFFVAHLSEALCVRSVAPAAAVYLLNGLPPEGPDTALRAAGVRPVIATRAQLARWRAAGAGPCAIQIDTGMNRLGLSAREAAELTTADCAALGVALALSHFVSSEERDDALNARQIAAFDAARANWPTIPASLSNSSGLFLPARPLYDLVRPGYALYGGNPTPDAANPMRPVVALRAPILQLRDIATGETVGYNAQWRAARPSRIATIGVGYADGYPRSAGGTDARAGAQAVVAGARRPLAGRVSMDLTTIDVTDASGVAEGDTVNLLGEGIGVDELAAWAGASGYEVLTRLGARYRRVYRA